LSLKAAYLSLVTLGWLRRIACLAFVQLRFLTIDALTRARPATELEVSTQKIALFSA
jgi:hypothetical protein